MIAGNHIFEIDFIKKAVLPTHRLAHHRPDTLALSSPARNRDCPSPSKDSFTTLSHKQTLEAWNRVLVDQHHVLLSKCSNLETKC